MVPPLRVWTISSDQNDWPIVVFWYSPNNMNWVAASILLQEQNAWSLPIVRVLLNHHRIRNAAQNFSRGQPILDRLIISVFRYPNVASVYQCAHLLKELAQTSFSESVYVPLRA